MIFNLSECQSVDESMILFKGRSSLRQYIPSKPIKRGHKVRVRVDLSGFMCELQIYTGKVGDSAEQKLNLFRHFFQFR